MVNITDELGKEPTQLMGWLCKCVSLCIHFDIRFCHYSPKTQNFTKLIPFYALVFFVAFVESQVL